MEVELLNYFNVDLKWNSVTKGRRSMTRRPRKPGAEGFESGFAFETNKIVDASLKRRKLLQQSSPVPQTPCLHGDRGLPAGPQTPYVHHEDPSHSNAISQSQKTKSKTRLRNKGISKYEDFSGIELLAAAACSSLINDSADHVNDVKVSKEHMEPGASLNQDTLVPDSQNLHDDGNQKAAPAKGLRLHWDLNTVMDEWEDPCDDLLVAVPLIESCDGDSFRKTCQDLGTKTIISSKTSDCESCVSKSDVVDSLIHQDKCEDFSTSTTSVLQEETVVKPESMSKSDQEPVSEEAMVCKSYCDNKVSSEDPPSEECCGSNVTQDQQCGDVDKIQEAGYDSPFEDGELREENDDTIENPLSEKVNHGQSSLLVKDTSIVEQVTLDIPPSQHGVEESDYCGSGKESFARKNVHIDESVCRNVPPPSRSSNTVRAYEHYRPKNIISRNYTPSGGYRAHNNTRPSSSSSERYNVHGGDIHRAPNRYRFHSQDYLERKAGYYPPKRRSRSRSPIAWHFQKQKKLDVTQSVDRVSPERFSKCFDDRKFTDKRESMIRYPERLKSDDHVRFGQQSGRFSSHKYNENGYNTRK